MKTIIFHHLVSFMILIFSCAVPLKALHNPLDVIYYGNKCNGTISDIAWLSFYIPPDTRSGKCMLLCLMSASKVVDEKGQYNKEGALSYLKTYWRGYTSPNTDERLIYIADKCADSLKMVPKTFGPCEFAFETTYCLTSYLVPIKSIFDFGFITSQVIRQIKGEIVDSALFVPEKIKEGVILAKDEIKQHIHTAEDDLVKKVLFIQEKIAETVVLFQDRLKDVGQSIYSIEDTIRSSIIDLQSQILQTLSETKSKIIDSLGTAKDRMKLSISTAREKIGKRLIDAQDRIHASAQSVEEKLRIVLPLPFEIKDKLQEGVQSVQEKIKKDLSIVPETIGQSVFDAKEKMETGIQETKEKLKEVFPLPFEIQEKLGKDLEQTKEKIGKLFPFPKIGQTADQVKPDIIAVSETKIKEDVKDKVKQDITEIVKEKLTPSKLKEESEVKKISEIALPEVEKPKPSLFPKIGDPIVDKLKPSLFPITTNPGTGIQAVKDKIKDDLSTVKHKIEDRLSGVLHRV